MTEWSEGIDTKKIIVFFADEGRRNWFISKELCPEASSYSLKIYNLRAFKWLVGIAERYACADSASQRESTVGRTVQFLDWSGGFCHC